ncbi:MAG: hypothetical protein HQK50_07135 [Oligoflexia bacterium]|nr:hypothetical protein [Oligoflexia bacterium]MBF0365327.1 hypothetical protein [Oligoflexia bacterium]
MAKGKIHIQGIYSLWRKGKEFDAYRVSVRKSGTDETQVQISAKTQPTLKQINQYLQGHKLKKEQAEQDSNFLALKQRLYEELGKEHFLKTYRAKEELDLKRKGFDFGKNLEEFVAHKSDYSIAYAYRGYLVSFWFPFFFEKGCQHPNDFFQWKREAKVHVKMAQTKHGTKYSFNSYHALTTPLNEYMKFLVEYNHITNENLFSLDVKMTLENRKQLKRKDGINIQAVRSNETYSLAELFDIKRKIDLAYAGEEFKPMKLRAYALYLGVCTGLRRGNILGIKPRDLYPESDLPHFEVGDNVVKGWSRGEGGVLIFEGCTKTTSDESIKLPLIQPSVEVLVEVATFLKDHLVGEEYILQCHPDTVAKWWEGIAKECDFKPLPCHQWKHSYASIGALHLNNWYKGNPHLLQVCCLHESYRTTEKYIKKNSGQILSAFKTT